MPSASGKRWWRRAASALKDRCGIYLARSDMEVALLKATSHDPNRVDYKNASRVFSWAKTSPSISLPSLLSLLSHRLRRTRSWPVALKCLLLSHGLLLSHPLPLPHDLPLSLSLFVDPSSPPSFSSFVRSYSAFLCLRSAPPPPPPDDPELAQLRKLHSMQDLLDLLMQVRPHGDDVAVPLILEAMDCVVVEIFDVYSSICNGVAHALVDVFGSSSFWEKGKGLMGIRVLRRAREQSASLSRYFELCRGLGVLNASELPVVDSIEEEDIDELERLVLGGGGDDGARDGEDEELAVDKKEERGIGNGFLKTVVTREWVVFDSDQSGSSNNRATNKNPFLCSGTPWELQPVYSHHSLCHHHSEHTRGSGGGSGVSSFIGGWENRDLLAL